jgi:hypothetical protein
MPENQTPRRWEVKDSHLSDWRVLPGEYTARAIWAMRARGDFWVAIPLLEKEAEREAQS